MIKVLIADDDPAMLKILKIYFDVEGYDTYLAENGKKAQELIFNIQFDLAILDWMMPSIDGLTICREIKNLGLDTKVLLLTAKGKISDEEYCLQSGADEYIRKPFEPQILLLRAKKLLQIESLLQCGDVAISLQKRRVFYKKEPLILSRREYDLLEFFLRNQNRILTREMLLNRVWGLDYEGDERTVDTHVKRLRAKIGEKYIITHRGIGYRMEKVNE